ncbi:MAG: hypothetical protein JNJ58_09930 [Chitinophagaceae bacterium]|nr:hypothetical protein [Chitinophagaceae bacterium]
MKKFFLPLTAFSFLLFNACKTSLDQQDIQHGAADFTRYVAIGNSLTSGFQDGALYREGQLNSFPHLMAQQFKLAGGGDFKIPLMDEGAGNDGSGNPRRILGYVTPCGSTTPSLSPIFDPRGGTAFSNVSAQGPYNLVGAPGARAIDANFTLYSLFNPYLQRFCETPGSSTLLSEALRINPTFYSLWLGNNDVLLYATGGAVPPSGLFSPALSDSVAVRQSLTQIADTMFKRGVKGVIANIPNVTSVPYFTTIPWNGVTLTQGKADTLNALYASLGMSGITWTAGANGFLIVDSFAPGNMRKATSADLILLTTPGDSLRCGQWGVDPAKPLGDQYVLDQIETSVIQQYISAYNASIASIAVQYNLAFVDMNTYLNSFKSGMGYNGISLSAAFVSGGAFSLDGVHPNQRGYALIANEFIKAINHKFGSNVPQVDVTKYHGVLFP